MKIKRWLAGLLSLALLLPTTITANADAAPKAEDLVLYRAKEFTFANAVLADLGSSTTSKWAMMTKEQVLENLRKLARENPSDYRALIDATLKQYNMKREAKIIPAGSTKPKTMALNNDMILNRLAFVYGDVEDKRAMPGNDVDGNEYRYLGYTSSGDIFFNIDFPPDASATYDMGARQWLQRPWANPDSVRNSNKPRETQYMSDAVASESERASWLDNIVDKYTQKGVITNKSGEDAGNFLPKYTGTELLKYAVITQPPTDAAPGQATMWHRGSSSDWYDSFELAPLKSYMALFVQYWDDLMINKQAISAPSGVTWKKAGLAQEPGTPLQLNVSVKVDMPRVNDQAVKELVKDFKSQQHFLSLIEVNGQQPKVDAKVYFMKEDKKVIGIKGVQLQDGVAQNVQLNWEFPDESQKIYAVIVPDMDKNPDYLEYYLGNNATEIEIDVLEKPKNDPEIPNFGTGLDNIVMTALIPEPGNGGKPAGQQINYRSVVKAELPTSYVEVSFNGTNKSNPIPSYPEVTSKLAMLAGLEHVSVSSSGAVTAPRTYQSWEYISRTCSRTVNGQSSSYECGGYGYVTRDNPNYGTAQNTVADIKDKWNVIDATIRTQGLTCDVVLVRGGSEKNCLVVGKMPNTESRVKSVVSGDGIRETTLTDNSKEVTMYPIILVDSITSKSTTETYNIDPKKGTATKNTDANPAKYGQEVQVRTASTAGIEQAENKWGYRLHRLYSEFANTKYGSGAKRYVPTTGVFDVSGSTPSASHYSVSKQKSNNKTWNDDFKNTAVGGSDIQYVYEVTRVQKTYGGFSWYQYETFWANKSGTLDNNGKTKPLVKAEVQTKWETKKDHHWIVDMVARPGKDPIGFWTMHSTLPPLKNGVPTPLSEGGKLQSVSINFNYKFNDLNRGVISKTETGAATVKMFGTLVSSVGSGG